MVTRVKDGLSKFEAEREFIATGDIGVGASDPWKVGSENQLRVVLENVGATNSVTCYGRIRNQSAFTSLATITGSTTTTIDISLIDEVYFNCGTYDASGGTPKLVVSGFFKRASSDNTTASNLGATGEGVFAQAIGDDLQFKKIAAGTGISVSANATTITVAANIPSAPRLIATFDTLSATAVGDLVRVTGTNTVNTIPDNAGATIPNGIFGVAYSKPTSTTVEVLFVGILGGYAGLTAGDALYISALGAPAHAPPATGTLQQIGFAISTSEIFYYLQLPLRRA